MMISQQVIKLILLLLLKLLNNEDVGFTLIDGIIIRSIMIEVVCIL